MTADATVPLGRILLIDDDEDTLELLGFGLKRRGYAVDVAVNGEAAVEIIKSDQSFDLIILDVLMPLMDGVRFLRWLRQDMGITVPVLVYTGVASADIETEALASGANEVLIKPGKFSQLEAKIRALISPTP